MFVGLKMYYISKKNRGRIINWNFVRLKKNRNFFQDCVWKIFEFFKVFFLMKFKICCGFCLVNFLDFKLMKIFKIFVFVYRIDNKIK